METQHKNILTKGAIGGALHYAVNQLPLIEPFFEDGRIHLDYNAVNLVGDGSGAEFRVSVSGGKITQVTVVNGGANYSNETNPATGLPLTLLTASGSGTGAVFELNISTDFTPVETFTVDFNNGRSGSSTAIITFATGHIYHAPGEYVDNAGFLSDIIKLQDNDYYQPYSM